MAGAFQIMTSMADAFLKAGKITEEQAKNAEEESVKVQVQEHKPKPKNRVKPSVANSGQENLKKFDDLWNSVKSKGFIKHVIHSFVPYSKIQKVWDFQEGMKDQCCFCRVKITPVSELVRRASEKAGETLLSKARFITENKDRLDDPDFQEEYDKFMEGMSKDLFGDGKAGYMGEGSKKIICTVCYNDFYDWVINQTFSNNELIRIIHKIRVESAFFPGD